MSLGWAQKQRSRVISPLGLFGSVCPSSKLPGRWGETRKMGFESFPIANQDVPHELTLIDDENLALSSSMIGQSRCRRSSIRRCNNLDGNTKNDSMDQKPAAKMLPQLTRSQNGTKPSVSDILFFKFPFI